MNFKEEIEKLLKELGTTGISRGKIEQDLGYSENYIDQTLSKGGNKKFLTVLKNYRERLLQKAIPGTNENLHIAIRELSESTNRQSQIHDRDSRSIERLITILEKIHGIDTVAPKQADRSGPTLDEPGTPGTRTYKRKRQG